MTGDNAPSSQAPATWHVPPGFIPVSSAVPGIEVYAPAPEAREPEQRTFKCPRCGGSTIYSAAVAALTCPYCGYAEELAAAIVGRQAAAAEFKVEVLEQVDRGWGEARREIHCESCGADLSLGITELATNCPFCASNRVVAREETQASMLRPGFLVPFQVDRETAVLSLRRWLAKGWMHPPELHRLARSTQLSGIYLPFWIFSARVQTTWKAEVGRKRTHTNFKGETRTEIKWEWKAGSLDVTVDDLLVPGTSRVSRVLLQRLYPFDLAALAEYTPAYLAGWQAQGYDVGLRSAWDQARDWMREHAKEAAYRDINSRHVRNFGMTGDLEEERWRYVLLPVYVVAYRYEGKAYQVLINGQTGEVTGQKPVAWRRVVAVLTLLLLPALALVLLRGLLPVDVEQIGALVGWGALVAGLAIAAYILRQAIAADDA